MEVSDIHRRRFRPSIEQPLERRALLTFAPSAALPMDIMETWNQAPYYTPPTFGGDNTSGSVHDEIGPYTLDASWSNSYTNNSSGSTTDITTAQTFTQLLTSTAEVGTTSSSTTTTNIHYVSSESEDGLTTFSYTFEIDTNYTFSRVATATDAEVYTDHVHRHYKIEQSGSYFALDDQTGSYTFTASGDESHPWSTTYADGATNASTRNLNFTINASGDLRMLSPGSYNVTVSHDDTTNASSGSAHTYSDSSNMNATASGQGIGDPTESYTLSSSGSTTQHASGTLEGEGEDGYTGTFSASVTGSYSQDWSFDDNGGNWTISVNTQQSQTVSGSWDEPEGGAGSFFGSGTDSQSLSGSPGSWVVNGVPFASLLPPSLPPNGFPFMGKPLGPPSLLLPHKPENNPGDKFYNYLIDLYNGGAIVWPFKGQPPDSIFAWQMAPLPEINNPVRWTQTATAYPCLGRPDDLPWFWSGWYILPFERDGSSGFVWQFYCWGARVDYGVVQDPQP